MHTTTDAPPRLPGLESVAAHDVESGWLHDALLGPHSADIVPYLDLARACGGPVLDLGAGAGRLAVPFARHGFFVEAVDRDGASLSRLRSWALRSGPRVHRLLATTAADLEGLRLDRRYQLALLAGTMVSAVAPSARAALLHEIASHLGSNGALALDYTAHDPTELAQHPCRSWAFQVPRFDGVGERVLARQRFDAATMRERISYHCEYRPARGAGGRVRRAVLSTDKWIVDQGHLARDLRAAGLRIADRRCRRIDERTHSVLLVCRTRRP